MLGRGTKAYTFIKKRYQLRFVTHFCGIMLAAVTLAIIIFYLYTDKELGSTYYQSLFTLQGLRNNIWSAMIFTGGIVIIFSTLAVLIITLIGSNKVAGPVYRLEKSLESIGNGDLSVKTRFREHDAIKRLADDLNSATEGLNTKISIINRNLTEIKKEAERLRTAPNQSSAVILEKIRLLKKDLSDFKTA